jgi:uncharacterized OB-fold protein
MDISRSWRLQPERLRLEGARCAACQAIAFPARPRCAACGGTELVCHRLSGKGEIYSFAEVAATAAPRGFEAQAPYLVALVKLEEGPMVTAQLTDVDPEEVRIGLAVEAVTRKIREEGADGLIHYGYKFRPRLA